MKKGLVFGILAVFMLVFCMQAGEAQARKFVSIGGGPSGSSLSCS